MVAVKQKISAKNGISESDFHRINNDTYGNPRYVIHFLQLAPTYEKALVIGRKLGGRKFHNKQYGGGIVFQTYDINRLIDRINNVRENPAKNPRTIKGQKERLIDGLTKAGYASARLAKLSLNELYELMRQNLVKGKVKISKKGNPAQADEHAARELYLYVHTGGEPSKQMIEAVRKNLLTKKAQGKYQTALAIKGAMILMEQAARKYVKEFGSPRDNWQEMFNVSTRREAAREWVDFFENEAELGNYDYLLPIKYQKKNPYTVDRTGKSRQEFTDEKDYFYNRGRDLAEDGLALGNVSEIKNLQHRRAFIEGYNSVHRTTKKENSAINPKLPTSGMRHVEHDYTVKRNQFITLKDGSKHKGHAITIDGQRFFMLRLPNQKHYTVVRVDDLTQFTRAGVWSIKDAVDAIAVGLELKRNTTATDVKVNPRGSKTFRISYSDDFKNWDAYSDFDTLSHAKREIQRQYRIQQERGGDSV